ncbi:non-LTR retroelement reverse transcriptase, putative [Medicago truncatula]|uniref:Non-LTR retroelement reverse transcriptase, putative n=1 Tax=Medicago truncatula TaxID=3880 RepID=A0A072UB92_MEDTR|nr:non-LTR retroelement reverse transcriptase, putative [Medicago truncatula]
MGFSEKWIQWMMACVSFVTYSGTIGTLSKFISTEANVVEAQRLLTILKTYEVASGQEINLSKSEVFFSRNMSGAAQEGLSRIIGVRHVIGTGKYLGLPSTIGRDKRSIFSFINDRIWRRLNM